MQVQLFGVGTKSTSPAITAQRRINLYVDVRKERDKTQFALVGRPGLITFTSALGANPARGLWAVNTLAQPLLFVVENNILYSVNNSGVVTVIGTLNTSSGDVSMVDDGTWLVVVDGFFGYYYNMLTHTALTQITDGNFTTTPSYVTWQDTYFIVTSNTTNQFQLSNNSDPTTWPAVNINFTGSSPGALRACIADHSVLNLFGDVYSEFWQDTGSPDFPYAVVPGSAQEFGLVSPWSLSKFDNSLVGMFQNKMGGVNVSRMQGFSLQRISDSDIDNLLSNISTVSTGQGFSFMTRGHPFYVLNLPDALLTVMYDGLSGIWSELQTYGHGHFRGVKFANFVNRLIVSDHHSGSLLQFDNDTYTDNDDPLVREVWTKHIWNDNKYIGISWVQIDVQSGSGTISGQGVNPVLDLQVSKEGGNSFYSVGYSSIGKIGEYTQRAFWAGLGAARDWVLKLRITDPAKIVITNAVCEMVGGPF